MNYKEKFKDPKWQKKRLDILHRDDFTCQLCWETEKTLHVHHKYYLPDLDPWDYPDEALITLCVDCHEEEKEEIKRSLNILNQLLKQKGFMSSEIQDIIHAFENLEIIESENYFTMFLVDLFCRKDKFKKCYNEFKKELAKHS